MSLILTDYKIMIPRSMYSFKLIWQEIRSVKENAEDKKTEDDKR